MKNRIIVKKKSQPFNDPYIRASLPPKSVHIIKKHLFNNDGALPSKREPFKEDNNYFIETHFGLKPDKDEDTMSVFEMDVIAKITKEAPLKVQKIVAANKKPKSILNPKVALAVYEKLISNSMLDAARDSYFGYDDEDFLCEDIATNIFQDFSSNITDTLKEFKEHSEIVEERVAMNKIQPIVSDFSIMPKEKKILTTHTFVSDTINRQKTLGLTFQSSNLNVAKKEKLLTTSLKTANLTVLKKENVLSFGSCNTSVARKPKPLSSVASDLIILKKPKPSTAAVSDLSVPRKTKPLTAVTTDLSVPKKPKPLTTVTSDLTVPKKPKSLTAVTSDLNILKVPKTLTAVTSDLNVPKVPKALTFNTNDTNVPKKSKALSSTTTDINIEKKPKPLASVTTDINIPRKPKQLTTMTSDINIAKKSPALTASTTDLNVPKKPKPLTSVTLDVNVPKKPKAMTLMVTDINVPKKSKPLSFKILDVNVAKKPKALASMTFDINISKKRKTLTAMTCDINILKKTKAYSFKTNDVSIQRNEHVMSFKTIDTSVLQKEEQPKFNAYDNYIKGAEPKESIKINNMSTIQGEDEEEFSHRDDFAYTSGFLIDESKRPRDIKKPTNQTVIMFEKDTAKALESIEKNFKKSAVQYYQDTPSRYEFNNTQKFDDKNGMNSAETLKQALKVYGYTRSKSSNKRYQMYNNTKISDPKIFTQRIIGTLPDPSEKSYNKNSTRTTSIANTYRQQKPRMQKTGCCASTVSMNKKPISSAQQKVRATYIPQYYYSNSNEHSTPSAELETETVENDWANSKIYMQVANGDLQFNSENYSGVYYEAEIPYIFSMLTEKQAGSNIYTPFLIKARNTLKKLSEEFMRPAIYESLRQKYPNDSLEATVKFLEHCSALMKLRKQFVSLFRRIIEKNKLWMHDILPIINSPMELGTKEEKINLMDKYMKMQFLSEEIMKRITDLVSQVKWFKGPFIMNKQNYMKVIKQEQNDITSLMKTKYYQTSPIEQQ